MKIDRIVYKRVLPTSRIEAKHIVFSDKIVVKKVKAGKVKNAGTDQ